ncbi:MAG: agmatinase family protein [Candidatus Margulisiibacteriota bacterium]
MTNEKITNFDPNSVGQADNGLFGLPFTPEEAQMVVIPVPWEVTTSYGGGTANGPEVVAEASLQVDLYHPDFPTAWQSGIAWIDPPAEWRANSDRLRPIAERLIQAQVDGEIIAESPELAEQLDQINQACAALHAGVKEEAELWLAKGKLVGLLGGDHSVSLGFLEALADRHNDFGILQIDAHMDLRDAYEGFTYSHASIMTNALKISAITRLVQVGIRDYCEAELELANTDSRVQVFTDKALKEAQFKGKSWHQLCQDIIATLPQKIYISFDIDGLHPALCPNTGTPVPGGFQLEEITYLLQQIVQSNRQFIGFDLVEVSPGQDPWDANVGARVLYALCGYQLLSNKG